MRPFVWQWLVIGSLLLGGLRASAETRPQYGGILHVMTRATLSSLDPGDTRQPDSFARRTVMSLLFDTLVTTDQSGRPVGSLAQSWQAARGNQRLQFRLRPGIRFQDGTSLSGAIVASTLRRMNPSWEIVADGDSIEIGSGASAGELLQELGLPRNAVAKRDSEDKLSGTGPFRLLDWQVGKKLTLAADDNCWRGRPFLDGIEINLDTSFRDQMTALELNRADLIEVAPEQINHISPERFRLARSAPIELLALMFTLDASSEQEKTLRDALRSSVERTSMHSVLLQGTGQATAALLPTWISGYGFVFPAEADLAKARQLRNSVQSAPTWTLQYDSHNPLARLFAERIALNARDAGLSVRPTTSDAAELRLVQIPLVSADPWVSLGDLLTQLALPASQSQGHSIEDLYAAEQRVVANNRIIPLFNLPACYASEFSLRGWAIRTDGSLELANAWLKTPQP
jgi:MarR-like DNA-binding transcriptional regulator SgrR of sgrS sRNA